MPANSPRHILLYGPPASGKLTVARALASGHAVRVLDNHLTVDVALRLFEFGTPPFLRLVGRLRLELFEAAAAAGLDVVSTLVFAHPGDRPHLDRVVARPARRALSAPHAAAGAATCRRSPARGEGDFCICAADRGSTRCKDRDRRRWRMPEDVQVLVEELEEIGLPAERLAEVVRNHRAVIDYLGQGDHLVVGDADVLARDKKADSPFRATVFDPRTNRAMELRGRLDQPEEAEALPSAYRPTPGAEELRGALDVLRRDERFGRLAQRDDVVVYQPMPPLADLPLDDGSSVRRPTLGIFDPTESPRHQIVAVDLLAGSVDWAPIDIDPATDDDCESHLPVGVDRLADAGGPKRVRVRVIKGGKEIWNLIVVRPRDSSPTALGKGSGVELRQVRYKGRLVLHQAHVPILNVLYDDGTTYRDWQNQETPFQATGSDPVGNGWRVCTSPPATILEAGTDDGGFQGVAFWYADGELRIVSELQAAWYRYISDWRLRDDGVIKPRFGFAGTKNPRTCKHHQHHAYWRLDFDIDGAANDIVEQQGLVFPGLPAWTKIVQETKRKRTFFARSWRVLDKKTRRGYRIVPGVADGTADAYGVSDLWFLRYHPTELDDGVSIVVGTPAQTQIQIDPFINGESLDGTDVVVWYAGHFVHDETAPSPATGHIVGPELRPTNWG